MLPNIGDVSSLFWFFLKYRFKIEMTSFYMFATEIFFSQNFLFGNFSLKMNLSMYVFQRCILYFFLNFFFLEFRQKGIMYKKTNEFFIGFSRGFIDSQREFVYSRSKGNHSRITGFSSRCTACLPCSKIPVTALQRMNFLIFEIYLTQRLFTEKIRSKSAHSRLDLNHWIKNRNSWAICNTLSTTRT